MARPKGSKNAVRTKKANIDYSISFIIAIYPHNPDGIWLF